MSTAEMVCLGVSGWGPLHWWLPQDGDPEALLARLRHAWRLAAVAGAAEPRASLLLASLVRSSSDLIPLAAAPRESRSAAVVFRHRLVCRPGARWLQLRSWECHAAGSPWRCCGPERCLDAALLSALDPSPHQGLQRGAGLRPAASLRRGGPARLGARCS